MKVQFCLDNRVSGRSEFVTEFNVCEMPTGAQINAIYDDIREIAGRRTVVDYQSVCKYVANKHLKIIDSDEVLTIHI